jgi:ketosteroid isomerase-like protein
MKMSRVESVMRITLQFYAAVNGRDVAAMRQLMSDDCLLETRSPAPDGVVVAGKEAVTQYWETFFDEWHEAQLEIEEVFGLGLRSVLRWRWTWEDEAGEKGALRGVDILRVKGGLISEILTYNKG